MTPAQQLEAIRQALADYMRSEGCGCCEDHDDHKKAEEELATLLAVPMYKDRSGYDFSQFESER